MKLFGYELRLAKQPRPDPWSDFWFSGPSFESSSGVDVSEDSALRYSTVWACVKVISEDLASLPLIVYEREGKNKNRAVDHPLYPILHDAPNPEMTAMQFREAMQAHILTWGNAYAEIARDGRGLPTALWPLNPGKMRVERDKGTNELVYRYQDAAGPKIFSKSDILHIAGLGFNGLIGYSVIQYQAEAIGAGISGQQTQGSTFKNGAQMRLALSHPAPKAPGKEGRDAFRAEMQKEYGGSANAGKILTLWEGMTVHAMNFSPADAQFLDSRKFSQLDICSIFRVPPHKIMNLDRATFSNIEQQSISYVVDTIRPWAVRWEQQINMKLLDGERYFAEHLMDGLLRGDLQSRYQAYATARQWGWLSVNDIRALENLNPVESGDQYIVPMNMTEAGKPPPEPKQDATQADEAPKLAEEKSSAS